MVYVVKEGFAPIGIDDESEQIYVNAGWSVTEKPKAKKNATK